MITVKVADANERQCEVRIMWDGRSYSHGLTGADGRVTFDAQPGSGKIYVDGRKVHEGPISRVTRVRKDQ
jgi:hypothetical protein